MTAVPTDSRTRAFALLHAYFDDAVSRYPDRRAVDIPPGAGRPYRQTATYAELAALVDSLASHLPPLTRPDSLVTILLGRDSPLLYAAQIAALKAGAAFVGLDPSFPDEHIRGILSDAQPAAVFTNTAGALRLRSMGIPGVAIIDATQAGPMSAREIVSNAPSPDDLAYIIYTSGTTGAPKGVAIEHRSIANLVGSDLDEFDLGPGDRVAQGSSPAYDSSVEEVWLAFASGATLVPLDDDTVRLGPDLTEWLRRERITVLCPPPTLLRSMGCRNPGAELPDLRLLYVGGEALTTDVAGAWSAGRRMVNGYGPTECTVTCLRGDVHPNSPVTIGKPFAGVKAWVLDGELREAHDGEMGELCIGGIGLARGYHRQPELTAVKFLDHPVLGRIYRTGDLSRREPDGNFTYHGRIDAQVKLRGYRIELEAIEDCIARQPGVLEAACRLQELNGSATIAAHIVPAGADASLDFAVIAEAVAAQMPRYAVPAVFGLAMALPKSVGGKLKRDSLPLLEAGRGHQGWADQADRANRVDQSIRGPRTAFEQAVAEAYQRILALDTPVSMEDNFFLDLGGSSLSAAQLVSVLRQSAETASITVRDVYEAPTAAALANRIQSSAPLGSTGPLTQEPALSPLPATAIQTAWLLIELMAGSALGCIALFQALPALLRVFSPLSLALLVPALGAIGLAAYSFVAILAAIALKRLLIGRYRSGRERAWSGFHVRHWIVCGAVRHIPWGLIDGTELTCIALRALGARIGARAHFHRGAVPLNGGWDLLTLGDDVTLSQECSLRVVDLEAGHLVIGPITIEDGVTVGIRACVGPGANLGRESVLTALSSLRSGENVLPGEMWSGVPARRSGQSPDHPEIANTDPAMPPIKYAALLIAARFAVSTIAGLPAILLFAALVWWSDANSAAAAALRSGNVGVVSAFAAALMVLALPFTLALEAALCRFLGRVVAGVVPLRSAGYIRVWLKTSLVNSASRWLSGTLFWPVWLRAAGMRVGRDCEISTIIDVVPDLVEIGESTFFADGIYLGPPVIHRGTVTLSKTTVSPNSFVGNHAVIPAGQNLPPDILIGVCTVADDRIIRPESSWFGHPPFELPRREIIDAGRELTHNPPPLRYWNRVFWEALRIVIPAGPACAVVSWFCGVMAVERSAGPLLATLIYAPLITLGISACMAATVLALKWLLLGRVKSGIHPLWSCWCSRWDFLYVIWGEWSSPVLEQLEGTLLLQVYLRLMGMKIGRGVLLSEGFAQVVDPDMLDIGDGATVSAMFQAHTFEDRVLKIDRVRVGECATLGHGTVPLYGADIGDRAIVEANSVVMKGERLLAGVRYEGAPTRAAGTAIE